VWTAVGVPLTPYPGEEREHAGRSQGHQCHHGRATREPCMEPATVEILAPIPDALVRGARPPQAPGAPARRLGGESDPERATRARVRGGCKPALYAFEEESGGGVLWMALQEARTYLPRDLRTTAARARARMLREAGGTPRPTEPELAMLRYFSRRVSSSSGGRTSPNGCRACGSGSATPSRRSAAARMRLISRWPTTGPGLSLEGRRNFALGAPALCCAKQRKRSSKNHSFRGCALCCSGSKLPP